MHKYLSTPIALAVGAALAVSGCSNNGRNQNTSAPAAANTAPAPAQTASTPAPGSTVAIMPAQPIAFDLDDQYNPCNDFAEYVNAKWNKANPIPADQSTWGAFGILHERSMQLQ
jgi:putative endopeptidase